MTRTVNISGPHDDDAAWAIIEDAVRLAVLKVRREHPSASFSANLYDSTRSPPNVDLVAINDTDEKAAKDAESDGVIDAN